MKLTLGLTARNYLQKIVVILLVPFIIASCGNSSKKQSQTLINEACIDLVNDDLSIITSAAAGNSLGSKSEPWITITDKFMRARELQPKDEALGLITDQYFELTKTIDQMAQSGDKFVILALASDFDTNLTAVKNWCGKKIIK